MQEKTKHEAADWGSCDMRSYRLAAKKVRGGDGGRWWNEPKSEICDACELASMSESDDVIKSWLSFQISSAVLCFRCSMHKIFMERIKWSIVMVAILQ